MPCISCNSEKLEESSLPPRAGQEHCQQQFHHRFVCLHLFFLRRTSSLQTNCESEEQPSSLEIATWPSSSSPRWSCSSCATCQESSPGWCSSHCGHYHRPHGQHHLHQLNLQHLWGGEHPLHPRLQGKRFTLNSIFNKEHEKHQDSHLYLKKHCAILPLQGGTRPQFGSCTSPTLFNSSWWVTEAFYHTCNQFEILILNCDMKNVRKTGSMSWTKYEKEKARWNICCQYIFPGCERLSEPSDILLCWQNFPGGHHQPCEVGENKQFKKMHISMNLICLIEMWLLNIPIFLFWYDVLVRLFLWMYTISSILCVSQGLIKYFQWCNIQCQCECLSLEWF